MTPRTFLLIALLIIILLLLYFLLPPGLDWQNTYRPAALAVLDGKSPYSVEIYYAAPWAAWFLIPFAILPVSLGRLMMFLAGLVSFSLVARKAGASPAVMVLFLFSAGVIGCLNNGNIEWLPLLAFLCPPWLGLILIAIKPQVGLGLGLYWIIVTWREKGVLQTIRTIAPASLLLLLSFQLYGLWFLRFSQTLAWSVDNTALGTQGVWIGAVLFVHSLRTRSESVAIAASPFLSPYALQFTWSASLLGLVKYPREFVVAVAGLWLPVIIRIFQ